MAVPARRAPGTDDYETRRAAAEEALARHRLGIMEAVIADVLHWAKAVHAAHAGSAAESFHHLTQLRVPPVVRLAASARISAAVHAQDVDCATSWVNEVEALGVATDQPWALAAAYHGHALLAPAADAPALFETALAHHAAAHRPYEQACTQLAYGEHLRRAGRRVEARVHLNQALTSFRDLRAEPLVARATRELRASGETARRRDPSTLVQLTPTELTIAQLVSQGMSNKDVAAECWISPRTVAFHLRNVFAKTGVTSRGELATSTSAEATYRPIRSGGPNPGHLTGVRLLRRRHSEWCRYDVPDGRRLADGPQDGHHREQQPSNPPGHGHRHLGATHLRSAHPG